MPDGSVFAYEKRQNAELGFASITKENSRKRLTRSSTFGDSISENAEKVNPSHEISSKTAALDPTEKASRAIL